MRIELGCLTRPWHRYGLEEALAGIAAAGFRTVGFTGSVVSADSTDADIARLKCLLAANGLAAQVSISQPSLQLEAGEAARRFRQEMRRGREIGLAYFIMCGTAEESRYEQWYEVVARCLDDAAEEGVMLLLKPHGGISSLSGDLLRAVERFRHPSFGICYDPGNIYYYTGQPAEEDLPRVAAHVRGMCIKDETGGKHGEVMITPGTGSVDFPRIFSILHEAGFAGPCWVECVGGSALEEINAEAAKSYRFINEVVAAI